MVIERTGVGRLEAQRKLLRTAPMGGHSDARCHPIRLPVLAEDAAQLFTVGQVDGRVLLVVDHEAAAFVNGQEVEVGMRVERTDPLQHALFGYDGSAVDTQADVAVSRIV